MSEVQKIGTILTSVLSDLVNSAVAAKLEEYEKTGRFAGLPQTVQGAAKIEEIIRRYGNGPALSRGTINNYASTGRIPVKERRGRRLIFDVAEVLRWDASGRPLVKDFYKDMV